MKLFSYLYDKVMVWAAHPKSPYYLSALSFAESSFFPIPPDTMLAPMVLAQRSRAWFYASIWFAEWGVWVVFIAGFSPIPYKIFTLSAGAVSMAFVPFLICSIIGRGLRFFLVAGLIYWGGERMEKTLRAYVDRIGWAVIILAVVVYAVVQFI